MEEFLNWDAGAQLEAMRAGRLTAEALMAATLERIAAVNGAVNAIVDLQDAGALMDAARAADAVPVDARGALHGLPIAVKDLSDVKGLRNTQGSPVFADRVSVRDARFVALMRDAGAIFIGKTNVPEFGLGSHSYNPVHGVTRNPYDTGRTAGGSSGGAAVALAARMVALADGSDMMGSLRNPAAWNNVYGFRPSWGMVPREVGSEAFWQQLSTAGPMARSPRDLALLLSVMAVPEPGVPFNIPEQDWALSGRCSLSGKRIGWLGDWGGAFPMEPGVLETCAAGMAEMAALGAIVEEVAPPFDAEALFRSWIDLRSFALAGELEALYAEPAHRARLKPEALWEVERGRALEAMALHRANAARSAWFARAAELFQSYDALALPVAQCWPFPAAWDWPKTVAGREMDTYHRWMEVVIPASLVGLPAVSVPVGFGDAGLPMGVQLIGARGGDRAVLELAQAWHEATDWPGRRPPDIHEA